MKKFLAIIGWVVAAPVLALIWFTGDSATDEAKAAGVSARETKKFQGDARIACASRIQDSLHNPSSVDWDRRFEWPVIDDGDGLYTVIAKYRAENGFGGMVKETRQCVVVRSGKKAAILGVE